jgi:response regulator RpfG family c-di-GMP phosphodiesterase
VAVVPLFWEGRLIGTLAAASEREHAFGPTEAQVLTGVASHLDYLVAMPAVLDDVRVRLRDLRAWGGEGARMLATVADAHAGSPTHDFDRLRDIAEKLATRLGLPEDEVKQVGIATMLHDVGKYLVPQELLSRPDKLTEPEWAIMRRHTLWGYELLNQHPRFALAAQVARWHHERWDGRGYPDGLVADEIPLAAAIATVADALDAMVYDRVYREGLAPAQALRELLSGSGRQFSPRVVEALVALISEGQLPLLAPPEAAKAA